MEVKKALLFSFIAIIISSGFYIFLNKSAKISITSTKSIKGIQTQVVTFAPTPTLSPTPTLTPTPTSQPLSTKIQATPVKQYGGWYWQQQLGRSQRWLGLDAKGKDIWSDTGDSPKPAQSRAQFTNPQGLKQQVVVLDRAIEGGNTIEEVSNGKTTIYVTPTPDSGPFDGTFTYDSSNGSAKIVANKPLKDCEGIQKNPVSTGGGYESYGALKGYLGGYVCELFFAPPNTPRYGWPYGAKAVSINDEVKTFGNW